MAEQEHTRLHPGGSPRLSVIVPVHNGGMHIARCLDSLRTSESRDFEVIVADDCSTDHTPQIVQAFGARYERTPNKMGPGGARNLGVSKARGEIIVFIDADVVVPPSALGLIAGEFDRDPQLAAVFGSYDEEPAWRNFLSQYKNLMHHYVHQVSSEHAVTFWAGCGAIRRNIFLEFGGFNAAKYPDPSIEDIELGYRISTAGRKIRLNKRLQVKHLKRWTVRGLLRADIAYRAIPWTHLILERRNLPRDLNLTTSSQLSAALVALLLVLLLVLPWSAARLIPALTPGRVLMAAAAVALGLLALNWRVYRWFARRRGGWFTARAVLAHWAYYFYSGATFVLYAVAYFWRSLAAALLRGIGMGPAKVRE